MAHPPLRVLLVEDDEDDFILTRDLIAQIWSHQALLDWVSEYADGLAALLAGAHDVYLVDYRLGAQTGLDLLRAAIAGGCRAPIILLTGLGDQQIDMESMRAGAADYLAKGQITPQLLERSIRHSIQRKKIEQKLRENEQHYRLLFDQNPHPMWVVETSQFRFRAANQAALAHYGYTLQEFLHLTLFDLASEDQEHELRGRLSTLRPGADAPFPSQNPVSSKQRKKDGALVDVELTWNLISFMGESALLVLAHDVTARLALENQLRQSQKLESIGTLAGGIAHDFNNLLGIIVGHAARLAQPRRPDASESLAAIQKAARRGADLVRHILTFAQKTDASFQAVNVNDIASELSEMLEGTFPKNIAISLHLAPALAPARADPVQLHQSLLNLCVNARDAMPHGGSLSIRTECLPPGGCEHPEALPGLDYLRISVSDTGTGMTEAVQKRIFEPFFTTKAPGHGTGLGLAVLYGVVKSHGGFLKISSVVGSGTTFQIHLPVENLPATSPLPAEDRSGDAPSGTETVLLVEDERLLLELMRAMLEEHGYQVITAGDGAEAVEVFNQRSAHIDLVLLDIGLPKLAGADVLNQLLACNPRVAVILVSGYLESELKNKLIAAGAADFVPKPYLPSELILRIRRVLDSSKFRKPR